MKKAICLVMSVLMLLALCACGAQPTAPAAEADAEPVVLTLSCFDTAGSFNDLLAQEFIKTVEEASGGNITFTFYQNGTFCSMMEDYDFVCSGSLDCSWTYPGPNMPTNPWGYSAISITDMQDGVDLASYLYVDNETCSAIVDKYGRSNGAVTLGTCQEGGSSVCVATFDFNTWDDLTPYKNGATRDQDMYAAMGQNVVALTQADLYDSLSRGVCDYAVYNTASVLSNKLVEVAPYVYNTRTYGNAMTLYMNAQKWDSLSAQQQAWMKQGAEAATAWSVENGQVYQEELQTDATKWIEASDEDARYIGQMMEQTAANLCLMFAENLKGQEGLEDMIYLLRVKEEWLGFDILPEAYASYRDSMPVTIER